MFKLASAVNLIDSHREIPIIQCFYSESVLYHELIISCWKISIARLNDLRSKSQQPFQYWHHPQIRLLLISQRNCLRRLQSKNRSWRQHLRSRSCKPYHFKRNWINSRLIFVLFIFTTRLNSIETKLILRLNN